MEWRKEKEKSAWNDGGFLVLVRCLLMNYLPCFILYLCACHDFNLKKTF